MGGSPCRHRPTAEREEPRKWASLLALMFATQPVSPNIDTNQRWPEKYLTTTTGTVPAVCQIFRPRVSNRNIDPRGDTPGEQSHYD